MTARLLVVGLTATLAGCATIMQGSHQSIAVASTPTGAEVSIDGILYGTTPAIAKLARKEHHTLAVTMDGYEPFELITTRSLSGWVVGNILFGGLIGLAVDAVTGGMYKIAPENISVTLQRAVVSADAVAQPGSDQWMVAIAEAVMFAGPDPRSQYLGRFHPGTRFRLLGRRQQWVKVAVGEQRGYVRSEDVRVESARAPAPR